MNMRRRISGFESNHIKIKTEKLKIRHIKVIIAVKDPSIVWQSATYNSFSQIESHMSFDSQFWLESLR